VTDRAVTNPARKQVLATLLLYRREVAEDVLTKYSHMQGVEDVDPYDALHHPKSTTVGTSNITPRRTFTGLQMLHGDMRPLQVCMHMHRVSLCLQVHHQAPAHPQNLCLFASFAVCSLAPNVISDDQGVVVISAGLAEV
jgi:hypothetical protein